MPVSANLGLNINPGSFFVLSKALSRIIFSILFRVSNHQIVGKRIKLNLLFKLSYLSSNFALTLGYLNPASNNPAQNCNSLLYGVPAVHLSKIKRLQNAAARLVSYMPKHSHITPIRLTVGEYSPYNLRSSDGIVLVDPSIKTKKKLTGRRSVFSCCAESMEQLSITYQE